MAPTRVLLCGWLGSGNVGDEAYAQVIQVWLAELDPDAELVVRTSDAAVTREIVDAQTVPAWDLAAVSAAMRDATLVIVGGGGLFQDYDPVDPAGIAQFPADGYLGYAQLPLLAKAHARPLLIWGNGVGPLATPAARAITRLAFEAADWVSVRDYESFALLHEAGLRRSVTIAPDPALQLAPAGGHDATALSDVVDLPADAHVLGISVRPWTATPGWEQSVARALGQGLKDDVFVVFIALHGPPHGEDHLVSQRIAEAAGITDRAVVIHHRRPDQIVRWIGECDSVLAMRYHAVAFAARAHRPVAALVYDPKVAHLAQAMHVPPFLRLPLDSTPETIAAAIDALRDTQVSSAVRQANDRMVEQAAAHKDILRRALALARGGRIVTTESESSALEHAAERFRDEAERARAIARTAEAQVHAVEKAARADVVRLRSELATARDDRDRLVAEIHERVADYDRRLTAAVEDDRRTRSSRLVRALRRATRQFARGSWSDRKAFLGWALRQARGQSSSDGWRFDMQLPAVASLLEGLDRPADGTSPIAAGHEAPRTRVGLARIREFLHANQQASRLVLIASGVEYDELKNQRATQLAHEMLRQGQAVLFAYFRWSTDEPVRTPPGPTNLLSVPLDEIVAHGHALLAESAGPSDRQILIEMPHPDLLELVSQAHSSGWHTVYDVIDDWHEFSRCGQATWYDRSFEQYLVRWCDAVTAVSPPLCDRLAPLRQGAIACVPNAVSPERYPTPTRRAGDDPPVIGYVGHLTASWFDYKLLAALAAARPDCRFELVGYGADEAVARCGENVTFLGPREPSDVAKLAARWRLALIPFKPGALAEAVSPLKLYEYLLWGVPVLVTGISHLADLPGVWYAGNADEAVARMNERLAQPVDPEPLRAFARQNTWRHRVEALAAAVAQPAPPCRPPVGPAPSSPPSPETSVSAEPRRAEHRVLFVYQYCSQGGVETSLRNRAVGGRQCGLEAEFAFYRDLGGRPLFAGFHHEFVSSTEELVTLVRRRGYDLVDIIDTPAAIEALDSLGDQPACLEVHTTYPDSLKYLAAVDLDRFGFVVVPSEMMKRYLIRSVPAVRRCADRVVVLPNSVDTTTFRAHEVATPPAPIALFVGRLDEHKNWRLFLDGLARLDEPAIGWVVGGAHSHPDVKAEFWRRVRARGLANRICWLPEVSHEAMPAIYSATGRSGGALVVTSVAESFGMTILEAAACGCPAVAGPKAGIAAEWAERGLLTLSPGRKPRDLARRLAALIGQGRGEREALAQRLRKEAERHVSAAIARRFVAQIEQTLPGRAGAARRARPVEVTEVAKP